MSKIVKQSVYNSIFSYIGIAIGFVNTVLLFPHFLEPDEWGILRVLTSAGLIFAQFGQLGLLGVTTKFFPYFRDKENGHNGFLFFALSLASIGYLLLVGVFFFGESTILSWYQKDALLFSQNYHYIYLIVFFMIFYNIFDVYLQVNTKTVVQNFLQTIVLRFLFLGVIVSYSLNWISFPQMVAGYVLSYGAIYLVLLVYLVYLKQFHIRPNFSKFNKPMRKRLVHFTTFSILGVGSAYLANYVDILMVGNLSDKGLYDAAIYATSFYIGSTIVIPLRSTIRIISIYISEAWKENDMEGVATYYKKVTNSQFIFAGTIFLGIWLNIDGLLFFLPPEYEAGKYVVLIVLVGKFFDAITGVNGTIIQFSNFYHYMLFFNIALLAIVVGTNYVFIPIMGIEGAALATLISTLLFNIIKSGLIWIKLGLQPFDLNSLKIVGLFSVTYLLVYFGIPRMENVFLDLSVRSIIIVFVFVGGAYKLKVSDDFTSLANKLLKKIRVKAKEPLK